MPLNHYGVLKGTPTHYRNSKTSNNHYQIRIDVGDDSFRIAVNVRSKLTPHDLYYHLVTNFQHPILDTIKSLPFGFEELPKKSGSGALDYLRGNLFKITDMRVIPDEQTGIDNDLNDHFDFYIKKAIKELGIIYAFGERWFPASSSAKDKYFPNTPDQGIHDIHMNQGNPIDGDFVKDNGVWQDGGILIYYPNTNHWVAVFLRFQSQATKTDNVTGHPIDGIINPQSKSVRILAALVNPEGEESGREKVLIFNPTSQSINLKNWTLSNNSNLKLQLDHELLAEESWIMTLPTNFHLSNKGGIINLSNPEGEKIDGVQYSKTEAKAEGVWVIF